MPDTLLVVYGVTAGISIISLIVLAYVCVVRWQKKRAYYRGTNTAPKKKMAASPASSAKKKKQGGIVAAVEVDRRFKGDDDDDEFCDIEKASAAVLEEVELQPEPGYLTVSSGRPSPVEAVESKAKAATTAKTAATTAKPTPKSAPPQEAQDGCAYEEEDGEEIGEDGVNEDGSFEYWMYLDHGKVRGPRTPGEMKALYLKGIVGHQTRVRWLPFAHAPPDPEAQDPASFSELREISADAMPPFMTAVTPEERAKKKKANANRRARPAG